MSSALFSTDIERDAALSACGKYRWSLSRSWDSSLRLPWVLWIMLNPSTADANIDDPTIRRCIGFARAWGYGGLTVMNLFNWRATDPAELLACPDPIARPKDGNKADDLLVDVATSGVCSLTILAWGAVGNKPKLKARADAVLKLLTDAGAKPHCLRRTKDGSPEHPLYLPGHLKPMPYEAAARAASAAAPGTQGGTEGAGKP